MTRPVRSNVRRQSTESMVATPASTSGVSNSQGVNAKPTADGIVTWIIMEPDTFASAGRSGHGPPRTAPDPKHP